jgi:hypothetical protein
MESAKEENQQFVKNEVSLGDHQTQSILGIRKKWIWMALLVLAVVTAGALLVIRQSGSARNVDDPGTASNRPNDRSPGSEVFIYLPSRSSVMVAVDEQSLDELIAALANREEVQTLVDAGKVFSVPNNTRVRVVEASFAKLKVRFLEGKRVMTEAWVPERWVR